MTMETEALIKEEVFDKGDEKSRSYVPVDVVEKIVQEKLDYMYRSLEQSNIAHADRLAGLITIANFEATLAERMIQNKYFCNGNSKSTYEELSRNVAKTMVESLEKSDATQVLELNDKMRALEMNLMKLQKEMDALKQKESLLQKSYSELVDRYKEVTDSSKAYSALVKWHEKCNREVPALKRKNSGLLFKQSWEEALEEFEQRNPKPKAPAINF